MVFKNLDKMDKPLERIKEVRTRFRIGGKKSQNFFLSVSPKIDIFIMGRNFYKKSIFFTKNLNLCQNLNFYQKSKFLSNFYEKSKSLSFFYQTSKYLSNFYEESKFYQKSIFLSKVEIFYQKSKFYLFSFVSIH